MANGQIMESLARANEIRLARAALKREVRNGRVEAAALLDPEAELPAEAESMPICQLLAAQWRWGPRRAARVLARLGIGEHREVGDLTRRERTKLTVALRGKRDPYLWRRGEVLR